MIILLFVALMIIILILSGIIVFMLSYLQKNNKDLLNRVMSKSFNEYKTQEEIDKVSAHNTKVMNEDQPPDPKEAEMRKIAGRF